MGGFVSETQPVRPKSRRRLVAACTAGILSLGAFALGTSAQAAEPGAQHTVKHVTAPAGDVPHIAAPRAAKAKLSTATVVQTPAPPRYDEDGDGVPDQLYRDNSGEWYTSLLDGNTDLGLPEDSFTDVLTPGDIDGATGTDVLALTASGSLQLFSSENFPGFSSWTGGGWNTYNKVVAVDDITGDGRPDLIARTFDGHLYLYSGTGNGSTPFSARTLIGAGWATYDQLTSPGDVDGDGISDLVARDSSGTLYLYKGTGNASAPYAARVVVGTGWNTYNQVYGLGNAADGRATLLGRTTAGHGYGYEPNGTGGFSARQDAGAGWNNAELMAGDGSIPYWGKKQLVGVTGDGTLYSYFPDNTGLFYARAVSSDPGDFEGATNLTLSNALGDDGFAVLLLRFDGTLYNLNTGDTSGGWSSYNALVGPGDLSGDGKGDLVGRDTSGKLYLFRGNGGGGLAGRQLIGAGWGAYNAIVGAGDLSGDGRADIVARVGDGTLYLYKGTGNASAPFSARIKIGTGWGQYTKLASAGDMDGDGRADLVAVNSAGTLYRYSATGTGQFKARVALGGGWGTYSKLF